MRPWQRVWGLPMTLKRHAPILILAVYIITSPDCFTRDVPFYRLTLLQPSFLSSGNGNCSSTGGKRNWNHQRPGCGATAEIGGDEEKEDFA